MLQKTVKGRNEIAQRLLGLDATFRRILIAIDGHKNVGAITALFPKFNVKAALEISWRDEFVIDARKESALHAETGPQLQVAPPDGTNTPLLEPPLSDAIVPEGAFQAQARVSAPNHRHCTALARKKVHDHLAQACLGLLQAT